MLARAQDGGEDLPPATRIERLTWTKSPGLTRLEFHGRGIVAPALASPSEQILRIDFTAADASALPSRLDFGTAEVVDILRIPQRPGLLPDGVSARFLLRLAKPGLAFSTEAGEYRVIVFVGEGEKASGGGLHFESSYYADEVRRATGGRTVTGEAPASGERLPATLAFTVGGEQSVRSAPSAVAAEVGFARSGEMKLADARRGDWLHLVGGGWLRQPQAAAVAASGIDGAAGTRSAAPPAPAFPARSPAAWSVVTLGTGLQADVIEILPGDGEFGPLVRLFRAPVRLARLVIRVRDGNLAFVLPPKKGRLQAAIGGRTVESLDPRELPLVDESDRGRVRDAFDAPPLGAGDAWQTILIFPGDTDFLAVTDLRLDVGGMMQKLFRVPGSGEAEAAGEAAP